MSLLNCGKGPGILGKGFINKNEDVIFLKINGRCTEGTSNDERCRCKIGFLFVIVVKINVILSKIFFDSFLLLPK